MNTKVMPMIGRRGTTPLLASLALGLASCGGGDALPSRQERPPVAATLDVARTAPAADAFIATGTVEGYRRVMPGTKVMGRIDQVLVREGDRVAKGAVLARIESRDLAAMVEQARAGVAMAEAQLANAEAQHTRIADLHSRGSVTDKNLEDALAGHRTATAAVEQARANLRAAEVTLSYATVVTPIAGFVVSRHVEAGDTASPGMPLFAIEDLSRLKVVARLPEGEVATITEGTPATVAIEALGLALDATVAKVVPAADRASRTFDVEVVIDNADGRIKSGMFARVSFPRAAREGLFLPSTALVERGQLDGVFVVAEDGVARLRWLRLGRTSGDGRVEVISGLTDGERYVVAPPAALEDGLRVEAR